MPGGVCVSCMQAVYCYSCGHVNSMFLDDIHNVNALYTHEYNSYFLSQ